MEATSEEATTTTQEEGVSTISSKMENIIARSRALQDPTSEGLPQLASLVTSLGKVFQCPDKKTAAMPAKAPTPGGGHPQSTLQQSASRGMLTHLKKAKLPTLLPPRSENFKLDRIGSNSF
jgi:hypothetical protein